MGLKRRIVKKAAALKWNRDKDDAPRLIAAGKGPMAERIEAVAREEGLPLHEDSVLASALSELEPGREIPPELYALAAEVYIFLMELNDSI